MKKDMSGSAIVKRQITQEDKIIGNLKEPYYRNRLHAQRQVGVSPSQAVGNISLAYYRGMHVAREDTVKTCISMLKKKFPEAAKWLKENS